MRVATLNDVADWGSGGTPKRSIREYFGSEVPWLSIADLNDGVVNEAKESLTKEGLANSSAKLVPAGTLFIAMYGSIGKLGIAGREMATSQAIAFAKPRTDIVDRRYLFHYLLAQRAKLQLRGRGGTQMNIGQADLKAWPIPLPDLAEQRRIADILDKADALRAKRREAIAHLDSLKQSIFNDMFGDVVKNSMGWETALFGEVASTRLGKMLDKKAQKGTSNFPYLRNANVRWFEFELDDLHEMDFSEADREEFRLEYGDVLICEGGEPGRAAVWNNSAVSCYFQKALHRARPDKSILLPDYLVYLMWHLAKNGGLADHMTAVTIAHLTGEKLKKMRIVLPPIALQQRFANRIAAVEGLKAKYRAQLAELDELFLSLQDRAFKGEL